MNSPAEHHSQDMQPVFESLPEGYRPGTDLFPLVTQLQGGVTARLVSREGAPDVVDDGLAITSDAFSDEPEFVDGIYGTYKQILDGQTTHRMTNETSSDFGKTIEWEGFFVYYRGETPVGMGGLYRYTDEPADHWVGLIGVASAEKGSGLAQTIIQHIIDCAQSRGGVKLKAYTEMGQENARAQRFYAKCGFKLSRDLMIEHGVQQLVYELSLEDVL